MARNTSAITRDSVFGAMRPASASRLQGITAPALPTRQTAVWLGDEEVDWLDTQCREIRRGGWRSITRSAFMRALIRSAMDQPPGLDGISGEEDLRQRLSMQR